MVGEGHDKGQTGLVCAIEPCVPRDEVCRLPTRVRWRGVLRFDSRMSVRLPSGALPPGHAAREHG
jgi:hypothetical protein